MMRIGRFDSGLLSSNMYVISENGHAVVIDPARDTSPGGGLAVDLLLITHEHYDHISGVNAWKRQYGAPLLCSRACAERIVSPSKNLAKHFDAFCEIQTWVTLETLPQVETDYRCTADRTFEDRLEFVWQGHTFLLEEIPGHSPGGIGILVDGREFFSGDSLLRDSEIEFRMPGGSRKQWLETGKARIEAVPKGAVIRPGHFEEFILT